MPMAIMAEYADVVVAAASFTHVGTAYSIGNATCRTLTSWLPAPLVRAWLMPLAQLLGSLQLVSSSLVLRAFVAWSGSSREVAWQRGELVWLCGGLLHRSLSCMPVAK